MPVFSPPAKEGIGGNIVGRLMELSGLVPLASGRKRLVFTHPEDPSLVIKVMRPEFRRQNPGPASRWSTLGLRYYFSVNFLRELREFVALRFEDNVAPRFLHQVVGFAETDLGLGLVSVALRGRDGNYAPTLKTLIEQAMIDARVVSDLERFCHEIAGSRVVVGDLHIGNIVYADDPEEGSRFVLVDGIGDKTFVPLLRMSALLNRRSKARKIARLWQVLERMAARPAAEPALALASSRAFP